MVSVGKTDKFMQPDILKGVSSITAGCCYSLSCFCLSTFHALTSEGSEPGQNNQRHIETTAYLFHPARLPDGAIIRDGRCRTCWRRSNRRSYASRP